MLIGLDVKEIDIQLLVTVSSLEGILFLGKEIKQSIVTRSSVEAEYRAMDVTSCEII